MVGNDTVAQILVQDRLVSNKQRELKGSSLFQKFGLLYPGFITHASRHAIVTTDVMGRHVGLSVFLALVFMTIARTSIARAGCQQMLGRCPFGCYRGCRTETSSVPEA